jgi:tetratricopeptide (TPR) repeat protein
MQLRTLSIALILLFSQTAFAEEESIASKLGACNQAIKEGDASKALAYAEQVIKLDSNNRDALLCKGRAHGGTGQVKEALAALNSAEKLSKTPRDHMIALALIGNVQRNTQQFSEAIKTYQKSLEFAKAAEDKRFQGIDLNLIGDAETSNKQYAAAIEHYMESDKLAANDNEHADAYERIAFAYDKLNSHDKAVEYQIKADLIQERSGDLDQRANAGLEMGRLYMAAGDYEKAERSINKVIKLSTDNGGAYWQAKSYYYMAQVKVANKQPDQAKPLLADAQTIAKDIAEDALNDDIVKLLQSLK